MFLTDFLFNAANFLLLLRVAISYGKSGCQWLIIDSLYWKEFELLLSSLLILEVTMWVSSSILQESKKILSYCTFISPNYTFSLAGNIIVYTPSQGISREKYFINHNIKVKMPTLAGNKQVFHASLPSTENGRILYVRGGHQSVYSRADILFTVWKSVFHKWKKITPFLYSGKWNKKQDAWLWVWK